VTPASARLVVPLFRLLPGVVLRRISQAMRVEIAEGTARGAPKTTT
jgi:hypothetical protein